MREKFPSIEKHKVSMLRVVFDTNIYISAFHFRGNIPSRILDLAINSEMELIISKKIIAELRGVLRIKFDYEKDKLDMLEELLLETCRMVEPKKRLNVIKADPDDNMILECAEEGKAVIIVSGDKHLLNLKKYGNIKIMTAREFLDIYE